MPPFHWATICPRPCRPVPIWGLTLEGQQSAINGKIVLFLHSDYAVVTPIRCKYDWDTTNSRCTYVVTADLDKSCIRWFTTQSRSPTIRWRCTYDYDDPDTTWAALGTLMQASLRSGYDLVGDICPDHINIYADHCRSLVHMEAYWCHGVQKMGIS